MGASKKRKDSEKGKRKRRSTSRSRSRSPERKSSKRSRSRSNSPQQSGFKPRRRQPAEERVPDGNISPQRTETEENEMVSAKHGGDNLNLSVDETNKLREKLGLKPIEEKGDDDGAEVPYEKRPDVHVPALSLTTAKTTQKIRDKVEVTKEKRHFQTKLSQMKTLAEQDEEESAAEWVTKMRRTQGDKELAAKRAKMLAEMDEEFGVSNIVDEEFKKIKDKAYTSRDLKGLTIEHDVDRFREGTSIVLTLKDQGVLDEEEDALINVNLIDEERAELNLENLKKKIDYRPYEDIDETDELGMLKKKDILSKYDEEIHGKKIPKFKLDVTGRYDQEEERRMAEARARLELKSESLRLPALQLASDYMTEEEMAFKKMKKKVRKTRKKEQILKADDLVPMEEGASQVNSQGPNGDGEENSSSAANRLLQLNADDDDMIGPVDDFADVRVVDDEAENELQTLLNRARKIKQKESLKTRLINPQKLAETIAMERQYEKREDEPSDGVPIVTIAGQDDAKSIVMDRMSEFCRTLGDIPTYGLAGNREEERDELMDQELEMLEEKKRKEMEKHEEELNALAEARDGSRRMSTDMDDDELRHVRILGEEPDIARGVAGAFKLAVEKGYIVNERGDRQCTERTAHLQAQRFTIEDKNYHDIDDKFRRRDRYTGPTVEFKEKDRYNPQVKLEYVDDSGRRMNQKEAFRLLSHRFHGKGSGKKKTEKRMKKADEEEMMKNMSSVDTPLNTVTLLHDKQKQLQQPYVLLSGNKKEMTHNTISKPK